MERLSLLCFAGTYGLALLGELARFVVRSPARWYATLGLTALGWVVQTAYLANQVARLDKLPTASAAQSIVVVSWLVVAIGLYLTVRAPKSVAVNAFVLPVVLALLGVAWASPRPDDWSTWGDHSAFWGTVHGLLLLGGVVSSCVAFLAGLMYLAQSDRLKQKRPPVVNVKLPSLEQSEKLNRAAITLAFPLLTAGLAIGLILVASTRTEAGPILRWTDPKVVSTGLMWLVFAALLHARYRSAMRGRRVMVLTVVAFAFLVFTWVGVDLLLTTGHGGSALAGRAP